MSKTDPMWVFENYAGAAELIDELEATIRAYEQEVAELKSNTHFQAGYRFGRSSNDAKHCLRLQAEVGRLTAALESQQAE